MQLNDYRVNSCVLSFTFYSTSVACTNFATTAIIPYWGGCTYRVKPFCARTGCRVPIKSESYQGAYPVRFLYRRPPMYVSVHDVLLQLPFFACTLLNSFFGRYPSGLRLMPLHTTRYVVVEINGLHFPLECRANITDKDRTCDAFFWAIASGASSKYYQRLEVQFIDEV